MLFALIAETLAIGENCANPTSRWDKAYCAVAMNSKQFQSLCRPIRIFPGGSTDYTQVKNVKGVIVMYHGYTACPDSFAPISDAMSREGYVTLVPLVHGHGINIGFGCEQKDTCVQGGNGLVNPSYLPTNRQQYIDFVDWTLAMVREEISKIPVGARAPGFFVGSLASLGAILSQDYDKLMNWLWSTFTFVGNTPLLMNNPVVNKGVGWGPVCDQVKNRGGFCNFRVKNLIALHTFADYAISQIDKIPQATRFGIIHSAVDGPARDAVSSTVVQSLRNRGVTTSKCRYELRCPANQIDRSGNTCGVPHACFSRAEAAAANPYTTYWEENLFDNIN